MHSLSSSPRGRGARLLAAAAWCRRALGLGVAACLCGLLGVPPALAQAAQPPAYLVELQQQARHAGLARSVAWIDLLHYKRHPLTRRLRSLADDPAFFLAPDGADNLEAELDATLAAFFDPQPRHAEGQAAQCRFRARYLWLREALNLDAERLPPQPCPRFDQWRAGVAARSVSLVFPAAYVNSPASMYGHTFLRLDAEGASAGQPLLAYAISYAAAGNEAEGLGFAIKGLLGLYPGIFSNSPYYLRIRDYTHLENRDIWEYELNLEPHEIERLLAHTWELGFTRFDYFFFDENCSYHLLSLLDVARPGLGLTDRFTWWAIPVDTVRAVVETEGLLRARRFRPSNSTELTWRAEGLPAERVDDARALGELRLDPADWRRAAATLDEQTQARTLELGERLLSYRAAQGRVKEAEYEQGRLRLLTARAALPAFDEPAVPTPRVPPEAGHATARIDWSVGRVRTGQGTSRNEARLVRLALRPAYHDLLDPEPGYSRGAQIQFVQLELEHEERRGLRVARFTPVDIVSLNPNNNLTGGVSWKVRFGLRRPFAAAPQARSAYEINGGPGRSWELGSSGRALVYAFMDNQAWHDRSLPGTPWAVGTGMLAGALVDPLPRWRVQAEVLQRHFAGSAPRERGLLLRQRWAISHAVNLTLDCQWRRRGPAAPVRECLAGLQHYR